MHPISFRQLSNFLSVLSLYDILYPEKEPLTVPDCTKAYSTRQVMHAKFQPASLTII